MKRSMLIKLILYQTLWILSIDAKKMNVYTLTTPSTQSLYSKVFLPTLPSDCQPHEYHYHQDKHKNPQEYSRQKVNIIIKTLKANTNQRVIFAEPTVEFYAPLKRLPDIVPGHMHFFDLHDESQICDHFFIVKANDQTIRFWKDVKYYLLRNPTHVLSQALISLLYDPDNDVEWNLLPETCFCQNAANNKLTRLPFDIILYHPHGCRTSTEVLTHMKFTKKLLQKQKKEVKALYKKSSHLKNDKFVLLTMLYNETVPERIDEYLTCLEENISNNFIESIHILYDTSNDISDKSNPIKDYIIAKAIPVTYVDGRQTFQDFFNLGHQLYPNRKIIIANADIYFNETLALLTNYNLDQKFIALSRWEPYDEPDAKSPRCNDYCEISQDAWIYQDPLKPSPEATIPLGTLGCDGRITFWADKAGLTIVNPCYSIQAIHEHGSQIRNYSKIRDEGPHRRTPPCSLTY